MKFDALRRLFRPPALPERIRRITEGRVDLREAFPLAYTPWGRDNFAAWLREHGRAEYGITDAEIRDFVRMRDDAAGVAEAYRWQPAWQAAVPDALTPAGWPKLLAHLHRTYGVAGSVPPPRFEPPVTGPGVNVLSHFRYPSGLQEEAVQLGRAIEHAGYAIARRDVPVGGDPADLLAGRFDDLERYPVTLIKVGAAAPLADVYARAGLHPRPGVRRIAGWSWELGTLPPGAVENADLADEVWTPTEFVADAVRRGWPGMRVTAVLPPVQVAAVNPGRRSDDFKFFFAFDMGSCGERKNPLGLIRAFRAAFPGHERAVLTVKVSRASANPTLWAAMQTGAAGDPHIQLIDRILPRIKLDAMTAACDCYVSLHRAEGLGLTMAEAMLRGKPVIATGYSGNLDFMTADTAHLVRHKLVKVGPGHPPYDADAEWAEPDEAHAAELLRAVYDDRDAAAALGLRAQKHAAAIFSIDAAAERVAAALTPGR